MTTRRKPSTALTKIMASIDEDTLRRTKNRMLIAGKIAEVLKARGISQRKFAELLGKRESEVSEILSGNRNFTIDTLSDIADCLNIDLLRFTEIPVTTVSKQSTATKIAKTRKQVSYKTHGVSTICVVVNDWQTCPSSSFSLLAL